MGVISFDTAEALLIQLSRKSKGEIVILLKVLAISFFLLALVPLALSHYRRASKRYIFLALLAIIAALELTRPYISMRGGAWNIPLLRLHLAFAIPSFVLLVLCFALIWYRQWKARKLERDIVPISPVLSYAYIGTYSIACVLGLTLFYGH
ncbi:MAG TPA: hypothetical protein VHF05_01375 [Candidatus Paceibacterota bacterium]|jgi:hypothetical protein|nr:hypothetical protein [Candidatus Paceibacterota bacterium]